MILGYILSLCTCIPLPLFASWPELFNFRLPSLTPAPFLLFSLYRILTLTQWWSQSTTITSPLIFRMHAKTRLLLSLSVQRPPGINPSQPSTSSQSHLYLPVTPSFSQAKEATRARWDISLSVSQCKEQWNKSSFTSNCQLIPNSASITLPYFPCHAKWEDVSTTASRERSTEGL